MDSEKNFKSRVAQNIQDWHDILEYEDYIHAFIENNRTVDECCSKVLSTFYAYVDGEEKDEWSNHAIINGLSAAANKRD